jgi:tRNA(adenine34) deaminase
MPDSNATWMRAALEEAQKAQRAGEVPVGAVVVRGGVLLGAGHNTPIASHDPSAHAEMNAIRAACAAAENYRLDGATIYVTLEPCVMCAGALVHARVQSLVFGARDLRFGGAGSKFQIADSELLNHRIQVVEGVLGAECLDLLQRFFSGKR